MTNQQLKRIIPAILRQSEILNSLLPPKPKNYSSGMTLDMYVGGFFGFKHEELCSAHVASYLHLSKEFELFDKKLRNYTKQQIV